MASLLKDFSPKRTREKKSGPQDSKIEEVHSGPVQEIIHESDKNITADLLQQYSYHKTEDAKDNDVPINKPEVNTIENNSPKKEVCSKGAIAQKEQSHKIQKTISLFELRLQCEEYLLTYLYQPQDPIFLKINALNHKFINDKMEIIAEYKKEISFGIFKDNLYFYKGEIILPEEYQSLTGFLREYFDIEKVIILYNTGEMLLIETGFCNFWLKDRFKKFSEGSLRELSRTEILLEENCLDCIFNWNCPFARVQQMSN
jgi:hypothetical protein